MLEIILVATIAALSFGAEFDIKNLDGGDQWIGIQGNQGYPHPEGGGFILKSQETKTVQTPDNWEGRFWARTWCDQGTKHCLTGDCGNKVQCGGAGGAPPASLVEIKLKGANDLDYYDISLVDGFNVKASIEPVGGQGDCKKLSCQGNINQGCPDERMKVKQGNQVVGCKSACAAFHEDQYCCTGQYAIRGNCKPTQYSQYFKQQCPDAYSYAHDDNTSTFTCKSGKYLVTFGG